LATFSSCQSGFAGGRDEMARSAEAEAAGRARQGPRPADAVPGRSPRVAAAARPRCTAALDRLANVEKGR
jgi:hypothetical protein